MQSAERQAQAMPVQGNGVPLVAHPVQADASIGKSKGKGKGRGRGKTKGKKQDLAKSNVKQQTPPMGTDNASADTLKASSMAVDAPCLDKIGFTPTDSLQTTPSPKVLSLAQCLDQAEGGHETNNPTSAPEAPEKVSTIPAGATEDAAALCDGSQETLPSLPCGLAAAADSTVARDSDGPSEELAQEPEPEMAQQDEDVAHNSEVPQQFHVSSTTEVPTPSPSESHKSGKCRSTKEKLQETFIFAIVGAVVLGAVCSLVSAFTGCVLGAMLGTLLSVFTFGVSVPAGVAVGGSVCFGLGLTFGCGLGFLLGGSFGYVSGMSGYHKSSKMLCDAACSFQSSLRRELAEFLGLCKEKSV